MMTIRIPGAGTLQLHRLVCDYNGTLARDGVLLPGVETLLHELAFDIDIQVITADTFGTVEANMTGLPVTVYVLRPGDQAAQKADLVLENGADTVVALGNGRNDAEMLKAAALGICLVEAEGAAMKTMQAADIVCRSAVEALELLSIPKRLVATLRT